ncbi:MAG: helix-turn-helix domain-containing protein [Armatimonadota bacterium]
MNKLDPGAGEQKLTYSVEEVARLLGISVNSSYDAVRQGEIPSIRIGRRILVPKAALDSKLAIQ